MTGETEIKDKNIEEDKGKDNRGRVSPILLDILPGSGISQTTVQPLLSPLIPLGCTQVHLSGSSWVEPEDQKPLPPHGRKEGMGMGAGGENEWKILRTIEEKVRAVRVLVDKMWVERRHDG